MSGNQFFVKRNLKIQDFKNIVRAVFPDAPWYSKLVREAHVVKIFAFPNKNLTDHVKRHSQNIIQFTCWVSAMHSGTSTPRRDSDSNLNVSDAFRHDVSDHCDKHETEMQMNRKPEF